MNRSHIMKAFLFLTAITLLLSGCKKDEETVKEETPSVFKKDDYKEYFICTADGKKFAVGNNSEITTSITTFSIGSTLYINTSNSAFISGSVASQEVIIQLKSFSKTTTQDYDLSGTFPAEVLKLNGTDDHYITNDGTLAVQSKAVKVTKIEDGFAYGTFSFTAYDETDKSKSIKVTDGEFKILIP